MTEQVAEQSAAAEDVTAVETPPPPSVAGTDAGDDQPPARLRWVGLLVAVIAVYIGLGITAVSDHPAWFLGLAIASQGIDVAVSHTRVTRDLLGRSQFGIGVRSLARELLAADLLHSHSWAGLTDRRAAALLVVVVSGLRLLGQLELVVLRRRASIPVVTRNVDVSGLRLPAAIPPAVGTRPTERQHALSSIAVIGAAIGVVASSPVTAITVAAVVVGVEIAVDAALVALLARTLRTLSRAQAHAAILDRVAALEPEVMLYHSGDSLSAYQVNMWLSTLERLPLSTIVLLRQGSYLTSLGETSLPVLAIPRAVDTMTFALPSLRVVLYTANVGNTIHMLREPGITHVFVGHGDSDKTSSSNPFSKVYSQIWVAGEAGRERYRHARIGVRDDDIVEVGRPQVDQILQGQVPKPGERLTLLYAPTWEGWTGDPAHTSLTRTGPRLVKALLDAGDVRVIYRPHPFTGTVSPVTAAADAAVRRLLAAAPAGDGHQIVDGDVDLYDNFNESDVLVADISSVVSDWVSSQKPYVIVNLTGQGESDFRAAYASARAAYLLDPDAREIRPILDLLRTTDPLRDPRRDLKLYLLGPDDPDAMTRFANATLAARDRAVADHPVRPLSDHLL